MRYILLLVIACLSATASAQTAVPAPGAQPPAFLTDSLDAYVRQGMQDWKVPGLAIVVLKDGVPVVMKGYGTREYGKDEPVDENTLFFIASNTKLFTGTALSQLDAEKKLSFSDKVTQYFPDFRLYDSCATRLLTVRDLLGHHLGTKTFQGDFTFWDSNLPKEAIISKMRLLKPSQQFRTDFGYCNSAFLTAGQLIPLVTGQSWEAYIQTHILNPLDMLHTYTHTAGAAARPDIAHPFTSFYGDPVAIPFDNIDNLGPAGALVSCVHDLSHWLEMQLDSGRYNGGSVLPWAVIRNTRQAGTLISSNPSRFLPVNFEAYGLGIFMEDYNGYQVFWHTGGAFGFVTNTCFVPKAHLAIAILTNNDDQSFFEALRYQILDAYLGVPYVNRSRQFLGPFLKDKQARVILLNSWKAEVQAAGSPSLPLSAFTGTYTNPLYGHVTINNMDGHLVVHFEHHPNLTATLRYMGNDKFLLTYSNPSYGVFPATFTISAGRVKNVTIKASDFVEFDPYLFVKDR